MPRRSSPRSGASPRYATPRTGGRDSLLRLCERVAAELRMPLLPWQRLVLQVGTELDSAGLPVYREVIVSVPRQSGKSMLLLVLLSALCLAEDGRVVAYTAQTGWDARRKLLEDFVPPLQRSALWRQVQRVYRAAGHEAIVWRTGSRIETVASVEDAGHGRVLDGAAIDEAWADVDDRREAALMPTMLTRPHAQLWIASSAGTEASVYWQRKVELGRSLAAAGDTTSGIAYFEWSAPTEVESDDEEAWFAAHPALGLTIDVAAVRHARRTMTEPEFRRAMLNIPTAGNEERVIPAAAWQAVCSLQASPSEPLRLAADALPDRSRAAIAVFGGGVGELVSAREGVVWLREELVRLSRVHRAPVVLDAQGPLAPLVDDLKLQGVRVQALRTADVCAAAIRTLDAIVEGKVRVRTSSLLDAAVAAVRKRPVGERWVWSRQASDADVSPFLALSLALGAPEQAPLRPFVVPT